MFNYRLFLPAIILMMAATLGKQLQAQQAIEIDEIKVIAPYVPTISDAFKINDNPRMDDTLMVKMNFDYNISPTRLIFPFEVDPISPAQMRGEPLEKIYRGHVKAGYGSYSSPQIEAYYNTLRSKEYALGLQLKHFSSAGKVQDYEFSTFSDNKVRLFGKKFFGKHSLDAGLGFERDVVHFYGFRREQFLDDQLILDYIDGLDKKDVRQHFNHISANVGFGTQNQDSTRLNYGTALQYYRLADRYDAAEHNLKFSANIGRQIPQDPTGFGFRHYFDLDATADYYNISTPLDTTGTAVVSLKPRIFSNNRNLRFHLGLDASVEADTASYLRVYPLVGVEVNIVPGVLIAYSQLSGGLEKHSMRNFSQQNPFMTTSMHYGFMNVKSEIIGGIKGSLTDYVSYNFSANNAKIDNYPFFVTDTASILNNQFTVIYDNIRRFNLRAELFSQVGERFRTRIRADFFQYSMDQQKQAWYLPSKVISLNMKYNIQDKIILSADAFARDSVFDRAFDQEGVVVPQEIHGFHVDVNLGIEYRYTRNLSAFVNFNNIQNQSLQRWIHYPSQRLNIMGGLSYSF